MRAAYNFVGDMFSRTDRHAPSGGDWRDVERDEASDAAIYQQRMNTPGWELETDLPRVVKMQPHRDPFNARKVYDRIKQLSVEIAGQQNQIDELLAEQSAKIDERRKLRLAWMEEANRLGCFAEIEQAPAPPPIPPSDVPQEMVLQSLPSEGESE